MYPQGTQQRTQRMANCVRKEREARGWSIDRLAELSKVSRGAILNIENKAQHSARDDVRFRLAEAFGMSVSDLFYPEEVAA